VVELGEWLEEVKIENAIASPSLQAPTVIIQDVCESHSTLKIDPFTP
jgi:hypothetical protein